MTITRIVKIHISAFPKSLAFSLLEILCSSQLAIIDPTKFAKYTSPKTHPYMMMYWIIVKSIRGFTIPTIIGAKINTAIV
ncbi:hypothetical protein ES703_80658 [subsurface metagenome]